MQFACSEELPTRFPLGPLDNSNKLSRVLVAEDDPLYRRALEHVLARQGYVVRLVSDGLQALQHALSPAAPRLLVLD